MASKNPKRSRPENVAGKAPDRKRSRKRQDAPAPEPVPEPKAPSYALVPLEPGPDRSNAGRRTKCSVELAERFAEILVTGCYVDSACAALGVGESTFYRWLEQGADRESPDGTVTPGASPYREFREVVTRAQGLTEVNATALLQTKLLIDGDARDVLEFLRRRYPHKWNRTKLDVSPAGDGSSGETPFGDIEAVLGNPVAAEHYYRLLDVMTEQKAKEPTP